MKIVQSLNYRQWQKRNSLIFKKLSKLEQKKVKEKGYRNIGWDSVQQSWLIFQEFKPNIVSIFEYKLSNGDLVGAINVAIMNSDQTRKIALEAIATLDKNQQNLNKLAEDVLNKYQPL